MGACSIPSEVLELLPPYLHNIEDYLSLTSVNRGSRSTISANTSPSVLLQLCYASQRVFFRPNPLFLLINLCRPLSVWSRERPANLQRLVEAFWSGPEAMLELAVNVPDIAIKAEWSLTKVRQMWEWRMRVVNPMTDLIDKCAGPQWYTKPDFWDTTMDAVTLDCDPDETFFRMVMYGELFGEEFGKCLQAVALGETVSLWSPPSAAGILYFKRQQTDPRHQEPPVHPVASIPTRLEFCKYLIPDWHALLYGRYTHGDLESSRSVRPGEFTYFTTSQPIPARPPSPPSSDDGNDPDGMTNSAAQPSAARPLPIQRSIHPLLAVQTNTGPYEGYIPFATSYPDLEFTQVIHHLITRSILFGRVMKRVRDRCGGDFQMPISLVRWQEVEGMDIIWQQAFWEDALWMLGLRAMELLAEEWNHMTAEDKPVGSTRDDHPLYNPSKEPACGTSASSEESPLETSRKTLRQWRTIIENIKVKFQNVDIGHGTWTYEIPYYRRDLMIVRRR